MAKNDNALVRIEERYPALASEGAVQKALAANLGGEEMSIFDLDRIKVPSGGGVAWEIPTPDGDTTVSKTVEGIIVFTKMGRSYWSKGLDDGGGSTPPDCSSPDGVHGFGNPGGICKTCRFAQFDTAKGGEGKGQACKQQRFLFILREGTHLPTVMVVPPTSLKNMKKYLFQTANRGKFYYAVVTKFELARVKSSGGIDYAEVRPSFVRDLTPEEEAMVEAYAQKTQSSFEGYHEGAAAVEDEKF